LRIRHCILIVLAILSSPLWAQSYRIASVNYQNDGRTDIYILSLKASIQIGSEFQSRFALDEYLVDRRQVLLNERVLESVEIEVLELATAVDGYVEVDLNIRTKDTWNIIALPYFNYDSNTGLLLSIRARDYNFLGSMEPLRLNFNRDQDLSGEVAWSVDADFSYPFPAFGLDWEWGLAGAIVFPEEGADTRGNVETSISMSLPLALGALELKSGQAAWFNRLDSSGDPYEDDFYLRTSSSVGWRIPLEFTALPQAISVRPRVEWGLNWLPGGLEDLSLDMGSGLTAGLGLSYGRIDWHGNFRKGISISSDAAAEWYPESQSISRTLSFSTKAFLEYGWIGPSARFYGVYTLDGTTDNAGEVVRGVLNSRAVTDAAIALNLDLPVRALRFVPYEWWGKPWMKLFQFEQHWSPFFDAALGKYGDKPFTLSDGWYGAGLEVITFPLIMRSFYIRISAGWSVPDVLELRSLSGASERDGKSIRELFIGLGHHY
jgi:hypothetical protein